MLRPARLRSLLEGLPGYTLIAQYTAALPVYELYMEVRFLARQPLTPIQVTLLECTASGVTAIEELEFLLGLPRYLAREGLAELLASDLIEPHHDEHSGGFRLTERGSDALSDSATRQPVTTAVRVMYDGLLGRLHAALRSDLFLNRFETDKRGLHQILPRCTRPDVNDIDRSRLTAVMRELRRSESHRIPDGEVLDVLRIRDTELRFRPADVLALDAPDRSHIAFRVLDRGGRLTEHEGVLEAYFQQVPEILPIEQLPPGAVTDNVPAFAVPADLVARADAREEEIASLKSQLAASDLAEGVPGSHDQVDEEPRISTREENEALKRRLAELEREREREIEVLEVHEHRPQLEKAFRHAKLRVLIVSPWLNPTAVDAPLIVLMKKALDRGVEIVIGWGMPEDELQKGRLKDEKSLRTVRILEGLAKEKRKGRLRVVHLGNTHEKVLIVDDRYAVIGSFNWLSFRGDKSRGFRSERSFLVRRKEIVERSRDTFYEQVRKVSDDAAEGRSA